MRWTWLCLVVLLTAPPARGGQKDANTDKKPAGGGQVFDDALTQDDPLDRVLRKSHAKVYPIKMVAGQIYRIDMTRKDKLNPFVRIEGADGKELADDDNGEGDTATIVFKAPADGAYKVIATSVGDGKAGGALGKYRLTVREADAKAYLRYRIEILLKLSPEEQREVVGEFKKTLAVSADKLGPGDPGSMYGIAEALEFGGNPDLAGELYAEFGKLLAGASSAKLAKLGTSMQAAARRLKLVGNPIDLYGRTLADRSFDWKSYRGKVVLIDFWATWCGPCRAEMPNVKKLYETYHDRGFDVVGISLDDEREDAAGYMKKENLPWVCLFDREPGKDREPLADYYGVRGIPLAILVDREGRVLSLNARGPELERLLEKHIGPPQKGAR